MANVIVVGSQWGDEGKGKLVDILSDQAGVVVRFQGGNNAGHTVKFADKTFILHLIPSGILQDKGRCVIGNGVVVDPTALVQEIEKLQAAGINPQGRLFISDQANLIMPYHKTIDIAREERLQGNKIGTTGRGIGPAYEDKVGRTGLRFIDVENNAAFKEKLNQIIHDKNLYLKQVLGFQGELFDYNQVFEQLLESMKILGPYIANTGAMIAQAMKAGQHVLFEGAQGTFLDVDHGTYPFVTSSNTVAGGACAGSGVGPKAIDRVAGVVKAYTTRVGSGPFPTELFDEVGKHLSKVGHEFGATTGRPRRCGWFDACMLQEAVRLNSLTDLAITKLDVLDGLPSIKICVAYEDEKGQRTQALPHRADHLEKLKPVYEELPGWSESTQGLTHWEDLPAAAKAYVQRLEELLGIPVFMVSTGPKREETIIIKDIYAQ